MTRRPRGRLALDVTLAVGLTVVGLVQQFADHTDGYRAGSEVLNVVMVLIGCLPLVARRLRPLTTAFVIFGAHVAVSLVAAHSVTFWSTGMAMAVAIYSAARWGDPRRSAWVLLGPVAFVATYPLHVSEFRTWDSVAFLLVVTGAAWGAGRIIGALRSQQRSLRAALAELDETHAALQHQVVLEERARIAREMHDVVAHGVSVMVVQAGAARVQLGEPDQARESLLAVETTGRTVLAELRRSVSLLRDPELAGSDPSGPDQVLSPGLADLPDLAESMRAAGLDVTLDLAPGLVTDPGRGLAVYRVVQEALTNTLRHAGPTRVRVRVRTEQDGSLGVAVSDDGPVSGHVLVPPTAGGNGLVGMRERSAMYGGSLEAGPHGRGFAVAARLPQELS